MANCPISHQLDAYCDDELDAVQQAAVEAHLSECPACARELEQIRQMTALFHNAPRPTFLPIMQHRLHQKMDTLVDGGLLRIACMLSTAAACVLIAGSAWLTLGQVSPPSPRTAPPPWVEVASATDIAPATSTPAAQWYLADASSRIDDMP